MPSKNHGVFMALKTYLESYPDIPDVVYGGDTFTPPTSGDQKLPFLIVDDVRFDPSRIYHDSDGPNWHTGNLAIGVMIPLYWSAEQKAQYAGAIADYFAQDTQMGPVSVSRDPTVNGTGYRDNDMTRIPILVPWEGFV